VARLKPEPGKNTRLSVIGADIARLAGMELFYDTDDDPEYDRIEQTEQADLPFLQKLCEDAGLSLKVTGMQLVIFDDSKYEQMPPSEDY
jgi:phage protein D